MHIEAHDFAEAKDKFKVLGATVIGLSHDNINRLRRFAVSECRSKFAVAADPDQRITKVYDSVLARDPLLADCTSCVISPQGKILYSYTAMSLDQHVANTLVVVKQWAAAHSQR